VTSFDQYMLINNELFLATHLLSYVSLQAMPDDIDRVTFLQDLQTKLAERKTSEVTEPKAALMWGFLIMSGAHIMKRSEVSKKQLLIMARYFQVNIAQPEGWGDGLLGAIGLKKDSQSNKKKILLRCFSCAIFAIFTAHRSESPNSSSEYENAMSELKSALSNKKFADVRMVGLQAISLIESKKESMLDGLNETVCSLIRFFYSESYLDSIEYFYNW
jgi:ectopic P granules protein 5